MARAKPRVGSPHFVGWLVSQLRLTGTLEVYVTNHSASQSNWRAAGLQCTDVHAVLRSPRGDGKESIVLVTPAALSPDSAGQPKISVCLIPDNQVFSDSHHLTE